MECTGVAGRRSAYCALELDVRMPKQTRSAAASRLFYWFPQTEFFILYLQMCSISMRPVVDTSQQL